MRTAHPSAAAFLKRDVRHVNAFFARHVGGGSGGVVADAALVAFVRMRRPRGEGDGEEGDEEGKEEEEEGGGEVVDAILERLVEGRPFEAAVAATGFADPGGRAGQEEEEEEEVEEEDEEEEGAK